MYLIERIPCKYGGMQFSVLDRDLLTKKLEDARSSMLWIFLRCVVLLFVSLGIFCSALEVLQDEPFKAKFFALFIKMMVYHIFWLAFIQLLTKIYNLHVSSKKQKYFHKPVFQQDLLLLQNYSGCLFSMPWPTVLISWTRKVWAFSFLSSFFFSKEKSPYIIIQFWHSQLGRKAIA